MEKHDLQSALSKRAKESRKFSSGEMQKNDNSQGIK